MGRCEQRREFPSLVARRSGRLVGWAAFALAIFGARPASAANICNETVASNRMVDGFPAYSQCTDSTNSAIYSNNGVDTATASGGSGWVRTQGSGGYQCTEWAHRYLYFRWNVTSVPNGNAGVWCDGNIPNGLVKSTTPVHGDIIVFAPGSCGADTTTGHVAVVDVVNSNGTVTFVEQNRANRRSCAIDTAACFLHATANDGSSVDGGAGVPDGAPDTASAPDAGPGFDARGDRYRDNANGTGGGTGTAGSGGKTGSGGRDGGSGGGGGNGGSSGSGSGTGGGGGSGSGSGGGSGSGSGGVSGGGAGGTTFTQPNASSADGCSCRLSGPAGPRGQWWLAALAFGLVLGLRRLAPRRPSRR